MLADKPGQSQLGLFRPGLSKLRFLRLSANLSQDALAARLRTLGCKFGRAEVSRIERGFIPLTKERRKAFADALGVPEEELT